MQCKDIPDRPVLEFLRALEPKWSIGAHRFFELKGGAADCCIARGMPPGTPEKLGNAKMGTLIRRGLVAGCTCGCRGDFTLTAKGRALLKQEGGETP